MTHINQRRDTAANWASANPVLQLGEVGWERPSVVGAASKAKVGDGVTPWNSLAYSVQPFNASSYATIASPVFTGDPQAPTPATADNDTSIATTAFVKAQGYVSAATVAASYAPLASPVLTGDPKAPTPLAGDNDTSIATTAFVKMQGYLTSGDITGKADLASPAFTGNPTAPTPTAGDSDTSIATTAFVTNAVTGLAPISSPAFTGNPTAPTPVTADNDTSVATTAFVKAQGYQVASGLGTAAFVNTGTTVGTVPLLNSAGRIDTARLGSGAPDGTKYLRDDGTFAVPAGGGGGGGSGDVVGPGVSVSGNLPTFSGTSGKIIQDSGVALSAMATLDSPTFIGTPSAPSPATADTSGRIATTAFVRAQDYVVTSALATVATTGSALDLTASGTKNNTTFLRGDDTWAAIPGGAAASETVAGIAEIATQVETDLGLDDGRIVSPLKLATRLANFAPLASPVFTGNPTAPTPATGDNDTSIATTAFVKAQGYIDSSGLSGYVATTGNQNVAGIKRFTDGTTYSNAATSTFFNTTDETTNYERARMSWVTNTFNILTEQAGTGVARDLRFQAGGSTGPALRISGDTTLAPRVGIGWGTNAVAGGYGFNVSGTHTGSSGDQYGVVIQPVINQSGTAGYRGLYINVTETTTGSGVKRLAEFSVGGTTRFFFGTTGRLHSQAASTTQPAFTANVDGDSVNRWTVSANGKTEWGTGSGGFDANLYRPRAGLLQTDTEFAAIGGFIVGGASAGGSNAFYTTVTGDTQVRFQILADGTQRWGPGGATVYDTTLYRSDVGTLATPGTIWAIKGFKAWGMASAAVTALEANVAGDTVNRYAINAAGTHYWGPGNAAADVSLYRSAAGTLQASGAFTVSSALTVGLYQEMGRVDGVASTPFIDFHSGSTPVDYDGRIIVSGGTGVSGQGTMDLQAGALRFNGYQIMTGVGGGRETVAALSATTGTATANLAVGSIFTVNLTGNITLAFSNVPLSPAGVTVQVDINFGSTVYTVTYPANTRHAGSNGAGVANTPVVGVANKTLSITMQTYDGGTSWKCSGVVFG